jgi:hypothetical protein
MKPSHCAEPAPLPALRRMLLIILLFGILGTAVELLFLGHIEGWRQWIPLTLETLAFAVLIWHFADPQAPSTRALRMIMGAFIAAGAAGIYYHLEGSAEFKLESNPALAGWALFWEAARSKNPPSLAPGIMIELGLLGLAYTFRHPALTRVRHQQKPNPGGAE